MSYEVIDEEQKIAACNVADLTASQAVSFFKANGADKKIGDFTFFWRKTNGMVVLNKDNPEYEDLLSWVKDWLKLPKSKRLEAEQLVGTRAKRDAERLNKCADRREALEEYERIQMHCVDGSAVDVLELIYERSEKRQGFQEYELLMKAYTYGVMQGKRKERARRKRTCCQEAV